MSRSREATRLNEKRSPIDRARCQSFRTDSGRNEGYEPLGRPPESVTPSASASARVEAGSGSPNWYDACDGRGRFLVRSAAASRVLVTSDRLRTDRLTASPDGEIADPRLVVTCHARCFARCSLGAPSSAPTRDARQAGSRSPGFRHHHDRVPCATPARDAPPDRAAPSATASSSRCVHRERSLDLERYWRSSPLVFSLLPRCHGLFGSQK